MIRKYSMHDTEHPPGQVVASNEAPRYLRDVIAKYWEEENFDPPHQAEEGYKAPEASQATQPSTQPNEGVQRLVGALLRACHASKVENNTYFLTMQEIEQIIKENT